MLINTSMKSHFRCRRIFRKRNKILKYYWSFWTWNYSSFMVSDKVQIQTKSYKRVVNPFNGNLWEPEYEIKEIEREEVQTLVLLLLKILKIFGRKHKLVNAE